MELQRVLNIDRHLTLENYNHLQWKVRCIDCLSIMPVVQPDRERIPPQETARHRRYGWKQW